MINQGNNVPDKTIAIFTDPFLTSWQYEDETKYEKIKTFLDKPPKKRNWFTPHFYKCLPLTIGNQYGFVIKSEYDISFMWNGEDLASSTTFGFNEKKEVIDKKFPYIDNNFGHGIITINPPFTLRTPPGVNLMTINPPNYVIPNITVMTGVIETDNIRRNFTFNLKIQIPNIWVTIPAGAPLAAFIPIPRYYADSFELKYAEDIFSQDLINEELESLVDASTHRDSVETDKGGRHYMLGTDIYENKFLDHQKP